MEKRVIFFCQCALFILTLINRRVPRVRHARKSQSTCQQCGLGVQNPANLRILREMITEVPMIVDAGVGTASDAAIAMELGADGVLMNTAIAAAEDSVKMAEAMKLAVAAGRLAYLAGRMPKKLYASASSPMSGVLGR